MAKVKITGHQSGSGVLTITAPNTSTDRTITLPDATATIATTTDVAARLPSITDGGNATAITIDASENIGIGVVPDATHANIKSVQIPSGGLWAYNTTQVNLGQNCYYDAGGDITYMSTDEASLYIQQNGTHEFKTAASGTADATATMLSAMTITQDGRGLSQFTAKAWVNYSGTGTVAINDSHNVSSITDVATGAYRVNFSNNLANSNFSAVGNSSKSGGSATASNSSVSYIGEGRATSYVSVETYRADGSTLRDSAHINVTVFGD